jgi:hypothetical protein
MISSDHDYTYAPVEDGTFQFNEMGLNFTYMPLDRLRLAIQLISRDLGELGNNDLMIDYAFGDYRFRNWLGVRAGSIRMAYGFHNETRDIDALRTSILLPGGVYREHVRDFFSRVQGGGVYGEISLGKAGSLSYQALAGTLEIDEDGGAAKGSESLGFIDVRDYDEGAVYNAMLQWRAPLEGLRFGVTGVKMTDLTTDIELTRSFGPAVPAGSKFTDELDDFSAYVFSAEYIWRDLVLTGEYSQLKIKSELAAMNVTTDIQNEGYYLGASYRFTDWFELGSYYSWYYPDKDDKDGDRYDTDKSRAWLKDLALSAKFDINDNWIFKVEGHVMDGAAMTTDDYDSADFDRSWHLFAAKATFTF